MALATKELTLDRLLRDIVRRESFKSRPPQFDLFHEAQNELDFVAFEAALVYKSLMRLKERSAQLGKRLAVVGNMSYGELAILPILDMLQQPGVNTYLFRLSSLPSDQDVAIITRFPREYMQPDFFEFLPRLVQDQPLVAVVDGTYNPGNGYTRYPGSFHLYCEVLAAVNEAISDGVPELRVQGKRLPRPIWSTRDGFRKAVQKIAAGGRDIKGLLPYEVSFWNPDGAEGVIGVSHFTKSEAYPAVNVSKVNSPTAVLMTSTAHWDSDIYTGFHWRGYFDERVSDRFPWGSVKGLQAELSARVMKYLPKGRSPQLF